MIMLITGGGGFLGSALCQKLHYLGHKVVSFDNYSRKDHQNNINVPYDIYNGDIRNIDDLKLVANKYKTIDKLFHLAFLNGTSRFYTEPDMVLEVATKGINNVLDLCREYQIKQFILASSSEVYAQPSIVPTPETERLLIPDPHNLRFSYSSGKIISEMMTIAYAAKKHIEAKIFRPHNLYGENCGEFHFIPQIIKKILLPENPKYISNKLIINIQGNGNETRSFCYISDAIDQIILMMNAGNKDIAPIYNIGIEDEKIINETIYMIADILNIPIVIQPGKLQEGSTPRRCPSMKKMDALGFKPKYSLRQGLEKTVAWYKEFYLKEVKSE